MFISKLRQRLSRQEGFTLIELLVVLIIIGVLLAIAVPSYLGFRDRAQQRAAASDVRAAIPSAEAFYSDNETYAAMDKAALLAIDSGLSTDLVTVTGTADTYCISAKVGKHWAHVNGPGGVVVQKQTTDGCVAAP